MIYPSIEIALDGFGEDGTMGCGFRLNMALMGVASVASDELVRSADIFWTCFIKPTEVVDVTDLATLPNSVGSH